MSPSHANRRDRDHGLHGAGGQDDGWAGGLRGGGELRARAPQPPDRLFPLFPRLKINDDDDDDVVKATAARKQTTPTRRIISESGVAPGRAGA